MQTKRTLKVFRYDPEGKGQPYYQAFEVPQREGLTVLDGLIYVRDHLDGSLAFRAACRANMCGSCAMFINGHYRLACETRLDALQEEEITVGPLPRMRVLKDLVVDLEPFLRHYEAVRPYLITHGPPPEREWLQSSQEHRRIQSAADCILCAACYSSCPVVWIQPHFLGPAAFAKAFRFTADSRDQGEEERLAQVDSEDGVWRCHTVFNCTEACPKEIPITEAIIHLKRRLWLRRLKGFLFPKLKRQGPSQAKIP